MCLTWCPIGLIIDNHIDCLPQLCGLAGDPPGHCDTCHHRQDSLCGLTRWPLPVENGCCHWNTEPAQGLQPVTRATLKPLGLGANEAVAEVLTAFDVPFQQDEAGQVWLDPADLTLPVTFGRGSDMC